MIGASFMQPKIGNSPAATNIFFVARKLENTCVNLNFKPEIAIIKLTMFLPYMEIDYQSTNAIMRLSGISHASCSRSTH